MGCLTCGTDGKCLTCDDGFYFDSTENTCITCDMSKCVTCGSTADDC